jgi:hypothetical protein
MDPLTSVVTALAAGAAAALQSTVEQGVKDSYAALKRLIQHKYTRVNVDVLEQDPASESRRAVIKEDLAKTDAATDTQVLAQVKVLLDALQRQTPETAAAIGVDLKEIEGASLAIRRVTATGTGVKVEQGKFSGDITIEDVQAGRQGGAPPNA